MHPRKIIHQNSLNMIIPSGIRILHPYNLHIVCLTDGIFLPVALLHHRILKMLFPVKFDCQNRQFLFSLLFVHDKIKSPHIKQIIICHVVLKHLRYGNFFVNHILTLGKPDIFERMRQVSRNAFSVAVENGWMPSARELICFSVISDFPLVLMYCASS